MEYPQDLPDSESDVSYIQEDMDQSEEQLGENKPQDASDSQQDAGEKMEDLADKLEMQMQQNAMQQASEDMESLRMLLENLIRFSFDQEQLMTDLKNINPNNPKYMKMAQRQRELLDDAKVLEDSLLALSKRVMQIQSIVNKEISLINNNLDKAIGHMQERQVQVARSDQQYVMTSVNNIALLLTEAFEQMQQQMQQMQGMGNCKKPGSGKPSPSAGQMRKLQQQLNDQLKAMRQKMEGQKKGDGKGKSQRGSGMSEELARLAAQQEALRNELQKLSQQQNKDGSGTLGNLDEIAKKMEETEKDIVNRQISQETLQRQEEILTRLLESEKAEREREKDERRESNEFRDLITRNPGQFEEYKKLKMKEAELLRTIPASMNGFYKNLVNSYFQTLEN